MPIQSGLLSRSILAKVKEFLDGRCFECFSERFGGINGTHKNNFVHGDLDE